MVDQASEFRPSPFDNGRVHYIRKGGLLPLEFGLSYPTGGNASHWEIVGTSSGVHKAVANQRQFICDFCGLKSQKYNDVLAKDGRTWDSSAAVSACIFCSQCLNVDRTTQMRSAVLIVAPTIPQPDLNALMRVIYVCRISNTPLADQARDLLGQIMARRNDVSAYLESERPASLVAALEDGRYRSALQSPKNGLNGLRLCPLDRRTIREIQLEFNQFPQILAFWRSKSGPFSGMTPQEMPTSTFGQLSTDCLKPVLPER